MKLSLPGFKIIDFARVALVIAIIFLSIALVGSKASASDDGGDSSSGGDGGGDGGVFQINLYDEKQNIGYDNQLLKLYLSGKISSPPPFGGPIQEYVPCALYGVRWIQVGPPRPGWYLWVPGVTRTYPYGPPYRVGQYVLGLYAPKYFCIVSISPLLSIEGITITMMGSSR